MKKNILGFLIFLLVCLFIQNPIFAMNKHKIAVFPVDILSQGSTPTIYPNTLSLVAGDITNYLSKDLKINTVDVTSAESLIISAGLYHDYKKLLTDYKNKYVLDYDILAHIAQAVGVNKILFISGGFDTQQMFLKRNLAYQLNLPGANSIMPSYRLNILATLVDPQSGIVLWEGTEKADLSLENFDAPSQYFAENVVQIEKIKGISTRIAPIIANNIDLQLSQCEVTEVNSNIITTNKNLTRDGIMTRDGHSISTGNNYVINNRKNDYKTWIKKN